MSRQTVIEGVVFVVLVSFCVVMRLTEHAANFAPVAAAALFAGFWFRRRVLAFAFPLVAMGVSDAFIGTYHVGIMIVVYAAMLFPLVWRTLLRSRLTAVRVGLCAVTGSVVFFVGTNLAVWLFGPLYEHTAAGLAQCYVAALPFFRNTMCGDLIWSATFFGAYVLARRLARRATFVPATVAG